MGILLTNTVEELIGRVLKKMRDKDAGSEYIASEVINKLDAEGYLREGLSGSDMQLLFDVIVKKLEDDDHPKNTPEQEIFRRARGIYLNISDEKKHKEGGFLISKGVMHTTAGSSPLV